ncbi:MFS transporter [Salirhabdus salicampi]|uniref:MFS transporter n=1 Tax=Salirhabdus salicampi TaxID=476102 RepID=UPI0020C56DAF|nr:MFS transporter [Salirhabdus salicampi]MCP8615668.1 MFS transporter [Salirhabdus salicampi]
MKQMYLFYTSVIFLLISVSAARPMTSLFAEELNASMLEIGVITSMYSVTPLIIAILAGRFVDRVGEKLPIMIGGIGVATALSLPFFFSSLNILYITQLLAGGSQLLALVAIQNGVGRSVSSQNRDRAISIFSICASIGLMLGPLIGGYCVEHVGFRNSYIIFSLFAYIPFLVSMFIVTSKNKTVEESVQKSIKLSKLLAIPGMKRSVFVSMMNLASIDLFLVYYPLYGNSIGLTPSEIGWVLMLTSLSSVLSRLGMPILIKKYGRVNILTIFIVFGGISYGIIPYITLFPFILMAVIVIGTGLGVAQPLTTIIAFNLAPQGHTGEVLGLRLAGNRLSQIAIPLVFAGVSGFTGLGAIFTIQSSGLMLAAYLSIGIKKHNKREEDNKSINT